MSKKSEQAVACFGNGFNCAQAVCSTLAPDLGLERETALRIAGAFGAGVARRGEMCGAVSGALMAIGLKTGKFVPEDDGSRERCYNLAQTFIERFTAQHGSIACRDSLGCDLSTPEGLAQARSSGAFHTVCPGLVGSAAEIVEEILKAPTT